jgi:uncharacterized membrane protein YeiB
MNAVGTQVENFIAGDAALTPIRSDERIQALDVVRGFALLGIFLMNVEWFNRATADIDSGMPINVSGIDYAAGWLIYTFVRGKFWTMFSLLFGMGFAVMLGRAQLAGRDFVVPYMRRIAALALFGMAHYILIWTGDILFSYAVGATALMLLFYARPLWLLNTIVVSLLLGMALHVDALSGLAASLSVIGLAATFLRSELSLRLGGLDLPVASPLLVVIGAVLIAIGVTQHMLTPAFGGVVAYAGAYLAARFRYPVASRTWRLGSFLYLAPFLAMALSGLFATTAPQSRPTVTAERVTEARKEQSEQAAKVAKETTAMTGTSYTAAVRFRAESFVKDAVFNLGFGIIVIGMFLIGAWFVQTGVMADTADNLPLFRRMALYGLPVGLGLSLISSAISVSNHPDPLTDWSYQLAVGLQMLGNLPACLGYVSVVVLMLHSRGADQLPVPIAAAEPVLPWLFPRPLGPAAGATSSVRAGGLCGASGV